MESDNWIVQNLQSALNTWNDKLNEIWTLLTQDPQSFKKKVKKKKGRGDAFD